MGTRGAVTPCGLGLNPGEGRTRLAIPRRQFEAIDALKYRLSFDDAVAGAKALLQRFPGA
jgi:hypothetical protein